MGQVPIIKIILRRKDISKFIKNLRIGDIVFVFGNLVGGVLDFHLEMLWSLPVLTGLALSLYITSQAGQKMGVQQMFYIHHFYEEIESKVHID